MVEDFDNAQSESTRRMRLLDENIAQCERQLQLVKDVAAEERVRFCCYNSNFLEI